MGGTERPTLHILKGGKLSPKERSGATPSELIRLQADVFLLRFQAFREGVPFARPVDPVSGIYYHLAMMEGKLAEAGDTEDLILTNRVGRVFTARTFALLEDGIQYPLTIDYAQMGLLEPTDTNRERALPINGTESMILAALLAEVDIPYTAKPTGDEISYYTFLLSMREYALAHPEIAREYPANHEENESVPEEPPNVTGMDTWKQTHPTRRN